MKKNFLIKQLVNVFKEKNNDNPIATEIITIYSEASYNKDLYINGNDVILLDFVKI